MMHEMMHEVMHEVSEAATFRFNLNPVIYK
jgi:hypothetical protein